MHDVVDTEEVDDVVTVSKDEHGGGRLGLNKVKGNQIGDVVIVPGPRCLLEAIQGVIKLTHHTRATGVDKADRLAAVHRLGHSVVKEDIVDVQLVDCPVPGG
jgi:hypothetical protein